MTPQAPPRLSLGRRFTATLIAASLLSICSARAQTARPADLREVLATGAEIARFGRVGVGGFTVQGITDDSRVLLSGSLDDGRSGLFWADGKTVTPLWISGGPDAVPLDTSSAHLSSGGKVVALSRAADWYTQAVHVVSLGGLQRVANSGGVDPDGNIFCSFDALSLRINDAGQVAFWAAVALPGTTCFGDVDTVTPSALYLADGSTVRRVAESWTGSYLWLVGLTPDGAVISSGIDPATGRSKTVVAKDGQIRTLFADGMIGPSGQPLADSGRNPMSVTASDAGEVVLLATERSVPGIYRTDRGSIVKVVSRDSPAPGGLNFINLWDGSGSAPALNNVGDVVVRSSWEVPRDQSPWGSVEGILFYPANGAAPQVLVTNTPNASFKARYVSPGGYALNNRGEVGLTVGVFGGDASSFALRWSGGAFTRLLASGDSALGNSIFASAGLDGAKCLATDGALATVATATSGRQGILCGDAAGFHLVSQADDPAPEGGTFADFGSCQFTGTNDIIFTADKRVPDPFNPSLSTIETAVYRAAADRIERVIGGGDRVTDGSEIQTLFSSVRFSSNAAGHIAVMTATERGNGLFLRRSDTIEPVLSPVFNVADFVITDDDVIAMRAIVRANDQSDPTDPNAILIWKEGQVQTLASSSDLAADGYSLGVFTAIMAHGSEILFTSTSYDDGGHTRIFLYAPEDAAPRLIFSSADTSLSTPLTRPGVIGFTASQLLIAAATAPAGYGYLLMDPSGNATQLISGDFRIGPLAINDNGTIAYMSWESPIGSSRHSLFLSGPGPTAASCPVPPTAVPRDLPTWTPSTTPTPSRTPPPTGTRPPTSTPTQGPLVELGSAAGAAGEQVTISVTLRSPGGDVAGIQNDINFDADTAIIARDDGTPDCSVNPAIAKDATIFALLPVECRAAHSCTSVRALVFGFNKKTIPDNSVVYACNIKIAESAAPGNYPLRISGVMAGNANGLSLMVASADGMVTVTDPVHPKVIGATEHDAVAASGGGCAIADPVNSAALWILICPAVLLLVMARLTRRCPVIRCRV